jgi:hypothetical protein
MKISFLILPFVLSITFSLSAMAGANGASRMTLSSLDQVAYIGDSEVALGGIGKGLSCLNRKNIIAFGNSKASTYVGGEPCKLFGSFHPETDKGDLCQIAKVRFKEILSQDQNQVDTVVVGLGDNVNSPSTFREMLQKIRDSGKKCMWVMPAKKIGNNSNGDLAKKSLTKIAEEICGSDALIDPSQDGSVFATISDKVHYQPAEGKKIGHKICDELINRVPASVAPAAPAVQ